MTRILVIDQPTRDRIAAIKAYALEHVYTRNRLEHIMAMGESVGCSKEHCIEIPMGYRVVYSIEDQPEPIGRCTHMSFSLDGPKGAMPALEAVALIMEEFGVDPLTNDVGRNSEGLISVWLEKIKYGGGEAVNVLNKMEVTPEWIATKKKIVMTPKQSSQE